MKDRWSHYCHTLGQLVLSQWATARWAQTVAEVWGFERASWWVWRPSLPPPATSPLCPLQLCLPVHLLPEKPSPLCCYTCRLTPWPKDTWPAFPASPRCAHTPHLSLAVLPGASGSLLNPKCCSPLCCPPSALCRLSHAPFLLGLCLFTGPHPLLPGSPAWPLLSLYFTSAGESHNCPCYHGTTTSCRAIAFFSQLLTSKRGLCAQQLLST